MFSCYSFDISLKLKMFTMQRRCLIWLKVLRLVNELPFLSAVLRNWWELELNDYKGAVVVFSMKMSEFSLTQANSAIRSRINEYSAILDGFGHTPPCFISQLKSNYCAIFSILNAIDPPPFTSTLTTQVTSTMRLSAKLAGRIKYDYHREVFDF